MVWLTLKLTLVFLFTRGLLKISRNQKSFWHFVAGFYKHDFGNFLYVMSWKARISPPLENLCVCESKLYLSIFIFVNAFFFTFISRHNSSSVCVDCRAFLQRGRKGHGHWGLTLAQPPRINWRHGRKKGVASVAIETTGQWCWRLLPGKRGSVLPSEGRPSWVVRPGRWTPPEQQSVGGRHGSFAELIIFISGGAADDYWIDSQLICNQQNICEVHKQKKKNCLNLTLAYFGPR